METDLFQAAFPVPDVNPPEIVFRMSRRMHDDLANVSHDQSPPVHRHRLSFIVS
jgi:hypothetical protein